MDTFNNELLNLTSCDLNSELVSTYEFESYQHLNLHDTYIEHFSGLKIPNDKVDGFEFPEEHALALSLAFSAINPMTFATRGFYEIGGLITAKISDSEIGDQAHYWNGLLLKDFGSIYKHMTMLSCANPIKKFIDDVFDDVFKELASNSILLKASNYLVKFNVITGVNIMANVASDYSLVHFYDDYFKNQTKADALDLKPKGFWDYRVPVTYLKRGFKDFSGDFLELFFDKVNVLGYDFKLASFTSQLFTNFSLETIFNGFHLKYAASSLVGALAKYGTEAIAVYHIKNTAFGSKFPNLASFCVIALECTAMIFTRNPIRD